MSELIIEDKGKVPINLTHKRIIILTREPSTFREEAFRTSTSSRQEQP